MYTEMLALDLLLGFDLEAEWGEFKRSSPSDQIRELATSITHFSPDEESFSVVNGCEKKKECWFIIKSYTDYLER